MRASRGEIKIEEILQEAGLVFKEEYSFEGLNSPNGRPLRFDFVVFDDDGNIDFLIEYQGKQHYEASSKFGCIRKELNHEPIKQIDLITCIILLMVSIVMGIALT